MTEDGRAISVAWRAAPSHADAHWCTPACTHEFRQRGLVYNDGLDLLGSGTLSDYERWLKVVSYRNYRMTVHEWSDTAVQLVLEFDTNPSPHPGSPVMRPGDTFTITHRFDHFRLGLDMPAFLAMVYRCVVRREEHEAAEHFLVGGETYIDPHAAGYEPMVSLNP